MMLLSDRNSLGPCSLRPTAACSKECSVSSRLHLWTCTKATVLRQEVS